MQNYFVCTIECRSSPFLAPSGGFSRRDDEKPVEFLCLSWPFKSFAAKFIGIAADDLMSDFADIGRFTPLALSLVVSSLEQSPVSFFKLLLVMYL